MLAYLEQVVIFSPIFFEIWCLLRPQISNWILVMDGGDYKCYLFEKESFHFSLLV